MQVRLFEATSVDQADAQNDDNDAKQARKEDASQLHNLVLVGFFFELDVFEDSCGGKGW